MADLLSISNTFMSSFILFLAAYIVMSSAEFASYTSLIKKNKSFIRILNKGWYTYDVHSEGPGGWGGGGVRQKWDVIWLGGGGLTSVLDVQSFFY